MHSRFSYLAIASLATLAFSGCEWGGAHDNTWNDGYSWANFTGTYRFVNAVYYTPAATSSEEDTAEESTNYPVKNGQANAKMSTNTGAGGSLQNDNGVILDSVVMKVNNIVTISSDSSGNLIYNGKTVGSVTSAGAWNFALPTSAGTSTGNSISITYNYYGNPGPKTPKPEPDSNAINLSFLNVTQQGNKLTMVGDNGNVYKGQLTGASTGKDGYVAAQQVRLSFEATAANGMKMTGHFSGQWSGAADKDYGVLSERTIQGTHNRAGNFVGYAADTTIHVPDLTISEIGVSGYSTGGE